MKKLLLSVLLALATAASCLTFVACASNDAGNNENNEEDTAFEGTYYTECIVAQGVTYNLGEDYAGKPVTDNFYVFSVSADNTFICSAVLSPVPFSGKWTKDGDTVSFEALGNTLPGTFTTGSISLTMGNDVFLHLKKGLQVSGKDAIVGSYSFYSLTRGEETLTVGDNEQLTPSVALIQVKNDDTFNYYIDGDVGTGNWAKNDKGYAVNTVGTPATITLDGDTLTLVIGDNDEIFVLKKTYDFVINVSV